jgi:hypothetical protein
MKIDLPEEMMALLVKEVANNLGLRSFLKDELRRVAAELKDEDDLIPPEKAAAMLCVTPATLRANYVEWGLDKSVAFGHARPFYFRSQIIARAKEKVVKGRSRQRDVASSIAPLARGASRTGITEEAAA